MAVAALIYMDLVMTIALSARERAAQYRSSAGDRKKMPGAPWGAPGGTAGPEDRLRTVIVSTLRVQPPVWPCTRAFQASMRAFQACMRDSRALSALATTAFWSALNVSYSASQAARAS
jgi:hypothetical protein